MVSGKLYPEDYGKDFGTLGIKFPMNANRKYNRSGIFNMSYTTEEQAVSNYINLLLTRRGERYMQADYGVGLQFYLFEQNAGQFQDILEFEINRQANIWLPYIDNKQILVTDDQKAPGDPKHGIRIRITFSVQEFGANRTIAIFTDANNRPIVEVN